MTVDVPADLPLVPMDFVLMVQVLVNLLDNALKYSPPDAPIEVRAHVDGSELQIQVRRPRRGHSARRPERVFDKFYRVQRPDSVSGTGWGCPSAKGSWRRTAGASGLRTAQGGGTVITFALPLPHGGRRNEPRPARVCSSWTTSRPSGAFCACRLRRTGTPSLRRTAARRRCRLSSADRPDLVILDLGLPDLDGIEVTRLLREWTHIPIIILSVRGQEADKIAALDAGADDYVTKPFGVGELLARMRVALRRAGQSGAEPVFTSGRAHGGSGAARGDGGRARGAADADGI